MTNLIKKGLQKPKEIIPFMPDTLITLLYQILSFYYKLYYKLNYSKNPIIIRKRTSDAGMFRQVLIKKEYDIFKKINPKIIVDAGANVGYASLWFKKKYPKVKIFAIEPEESNFKILGKNISYYLNIEPIHAGLWNKKTYLKIVDLKSSKCSFMTREVKSKKDADFPTIQLNDIIKKINGGRIDILKIDIEGSEKEVFSKNIEWVDNVDTIIIELHEKRKKGCNDSVHSLLKKQDWLEFKKGENNIFIRRDKIKKKDIIIKKMTEC